MNITKVRSEHPRFPGYLYVPETQGPHPGILLLHGSEGGFGDFWKMPDEPSFPVGESKYTAQLAKHFATLGFAAYAYSYFHADSIEGFSSYPPSELVNVDINDTAEALEWLRSSPYVDGLPIGIWGGSRGAELALILSSVKSQLKNLNANSNVIIASSPSDFIYPGFSEEAAKAISTGAPFPEHFPSAWCLNGNPIKMYSPIEIEKTSAPILITYGAEDSVWGPYVDIKKLEQRLVSSGRHFVHFDFSNNEDPKTLMELINEAISDKKTSPKFVFIRFLDEGHSPRPNTNSSLLQSMATEFFLKTYLKD